ncbi:MAG TPA: hypothetical protein PLC91_03405 [Candidatus Cloacimonadota bacterium]|nr:hypothetical protein [Candidatus Cloacimonadota bacterium]HQH49777.1 hypothetical protein [Candidatus Cloacimonadota bacterium]
MSLNMKISYDSIETKENLDARQRSHPNLYNQFRDYLATIKELDYDAMLSLIAEESLKPNRYQIIKELERGKYEFRIPPNDKKGGVLRVYFELEDDRYTLIITGSQVKTLTPSNTKKDRRDHDGKNQTKRKPKKHKQ